MSDKSKLVYICSPYRTGAVWTNVKRAREYCKLAVEYGVVPVAPHLLYPQFLDDAKPEERKFGLRCGLSLLEMCAELWCFADPKESEGMTAEILFAKEHGIPVLRVCTMRIFSSDGSSRLQITNDLEGISSENDEFDECWERIVSPPEYLKENKEK